MREHFLKVSTASPTACCFVSSEQKYQFFMVFTYMNLTNRSTNLQTERKTSKRTDGWTDSLIEKPRHTQSYRNARSLLEITPMVKKNRKIENKSAMKGHIKRFRFFSKISLPTISPTVFLDSGDIIAWVYRNLCHVRRPKCNSYL